MQAYCKRGGKRVQTLAPVKNVAIMRENHLTCAFSSSFLKLWLLTLVRFINSHMLSCALVNSRTLSSVNFHVLATLINLHVLSSTLYAFIKFHALSPTLVIVMSTHTQSCQSRHRTLSSAIMLSRQPSYRIVNCVVNYCAHAVVNFHTR